MRRLRWLKKTIGVLILVSFLFFTLAPIATTAENQASENDSVYYIIVDRFYNGDQANDFEVNSQDPLAYHGGDFQGIIKQINYIKKMGFTTIVLSPIFESEDDRYFSKKIKDYYKLNRHFGSMEDFKELINVAHENELKVILDLPITDEITLNELSVVAKWWVEETNVDGYLLEKQAEFAITDYERFAEEVKTVNEKIFIIVKSDDESLDLQSSSIDSFLLRELTERMREVLTKPDQFLTPLFNYSLENEQSRHFWKYIDDAQTTRFTYELVQQNQYPGDRWPLILTYMYTTPGVPFIFYGSEIAVNGGEGAENHRLMDFRADSELIEFIEKLGKIRNHYPSLTKGDMKLLYDKDGMTIYSRTYEDETMIIALNNTSENQVVEISNEQIEPNKQLSGLIEGELIKESDGKYLIHINQQQSEIFIVQNKTGINVVNTVVMSLVPVVFVLIYYYMWRRGKKKVANE